MGDRDKDIRGEPIGVVTAAIPCRDTLVIHVKGDPCRRPALCGCVVCVVGSPESGATPSDPGDQPERVPVIQPVWVRFGDMGDVVCASFSYQPGATRFGVVVPFGYRLKCHPALGAVYRSYWCNDCPMGPHAVYAAARDRYMSWRFIEPIPHAEAAKPPAPKPFQYDWEGK